MGVGLLNGHAAHADRAETLNRHHAVGRHGSLYRLLRGAVNVNKNGVAGTEAVVLRRSDVHLRLEGQLLIIKYVTAEHLCFLFLLVAVHIPLYDGRRVRHELVQLVLHHQPVVVGFIIRRRLVIVVVARVLQAVRRSVLVVILFVSFLFLRFRVVLTQPFVLAVVLSCADGAEALLLCQALILLPYAANLLYVNAALHKLSNDLRLRSAR